MADIFNLDSTVQEAVLATSSITVGPGHIDTSLGSPIWVSGVSQVQLQSVDYSELSQQLVNFAFATDQPVPTSEAPVQIDNYVYANNSDIQQSQTVGESKTTVATVQVTVSQGMQSTIGSSFNVGFPGYGGASVSFSTQTSFATADQQSQSVTQVWNCSTPIQVPPRKGVRVTWSVLTAEYTVPFSGSVRFAGSVTGHIAQWLTGQFGAPEWPSPIVVPYTTAIGKLFLQYPNPRVNVIDANTIEIAVSGVSNSVNGIDLKTDLEQYDLTPQQNVLASKTLFHFRPAIGMPSRKG